MRLEWVFAEMYFLYSMALGLVLLLGSPYWLFQILWQGKYRKGLSQRFGLIPRSFRERGRSEIWVHAVSVGEVLAVTKLIEALRKDFPDRSLVVSTTTDTGQTLAAGRFGQDQVFYFPLDFKFSTERWFAALRPGLVVIAETELWPNFLRVAHRSGAAVVIVNARVSDRSYTGYRKAKWLLMRILENVTVFLAQSAEDAARLIEIGAARDRVRVAGNLKYDVSLPPTLPITERLRNASEAARAWPVVVCGSTVEGEETLLMNAFEKILAAFPSTLMLLAPRHPERFSSVARLLAQSGMRFWKRSQWDGSPIHGGILLIDSIGELASLYGLADLAFVGGSLVKRGGHNILEPAQHGVPIVVGPHTENFRQMVAQFARHDAVCVVRGNDLSATMLELLRNDER
ncbi:MAG: 3-deoxy-D-manno-octulosonic acid transferase, partial [Acidobacteria bacterium]|nr:3-deoxy-D-manno-octulosonic acid transferase [Acidobacteriota bacterium]